MSNSILKAIKKNYTPSLSSRISDGFSNIGLFFIVCLAIIFRPLNLFVIGLVAIATMLIF